MSAWTLSSVGRGRYQIPIYQIPAPTAVKASFDGGATFVDGTPTGATKTLTLPDGTTAAAPIYEWIVRGPGFVPPGGDTQPSTLVTASVRPLLQLTAQPSMDVHRGPEIYLRTP